MRRLLLIATVAAALFAPAAQATPPAVTAAAAHPVVAAGTSITLTASGDAATYHWNLGDGQSADGPSVQHTYAPGAYTAIVTATSAGGETTTAQVHVAAVAVVLGKPRHAVGFGHRLTFSGRVVPVLGRVQIVRGSTVIGSAKPKQNGVFHVTRRVRVPGTYAAQLAGIASAPVPVTVKPLLLAHVVGAPAVGQQLALVARVKPAGAGSLRVRIWRGDALRVDQEYTTAARVRLDTSRPRAFRISVTLKPNAGWTTTGRNLRASVVQPNLGPGSQGPSVLALEQRLSDLHYALLRVDGAYGQDTYDAVIAFQKLHGLDRTGRVDARFWSVLAQASIPPARYGGDHVEVDKSRQVLFEVRGGKVVLVVPVSTGATGNTPLGVWHVYSHVAGWSWVLWFPTYFLRGFAIHGYPDVPTYPASHGCVRVPMWVATRLYGMNPIGTTIYVYY
ncbi:MAG: hypothetical protein QOE36_3606 [Gaiellaceae bacterium]|jgi:hypothetical protein|nr:hypothetical protein [Gaiellaceae bacterium]